MFCKIHDICHTLQIVEYNQTKIILSCDQSDHSQFIIQTSYSQFNINPQDLSCSQYQHEACYPKIKTIKHIQYNNDNENKKFTSTLQKITQQTIQKVQVTLNIKKKKPISLSKLLIFQSTPLIPGYKIQQ